MHLITADKLSRDQLFQMSDGQKRPFFIYTGDSQCNYLHSGMKGVILQPKQFVWVKAK